MGAPQHTWDIETLKKKHVPDKGTLADTEGGACLIRHGAVRRNGKLIESSCNHAWQGWKKAQTGAEHGRYDWPAYRPLSRAGEQKTLRLMDRGGIMRTRNAPTQGEWDLTHGSNFQRNCNTPYWHEAHHIVPNSVLERAVDNVVKDSDAPQTYKELIGCGLLDAKYNLNHMENLILLPGEERVAAVLRLLRHLETERHRDHLPYRQYVLSKVQPKLAPVQAELEAHGTPDYEASADDIVGVSRTVRSEIKRAGSRGTGASLDEEFPGAEAPRPAPKKPRAARPPGSAR